VWDVPSRPPCLSREVRDPVNKDSAARARLRMPRSNEPRLRCRPPEEPRVRAEPRPSLTPSRAETRVGDTCVVARARWYASATLSGLPLVGHARLPRPPKADKSSQKRNERRAGILELQTLNHQIIPNSGMSAGALSFQFFSGRKRPAIAVCFPQTRPGVREGRRRWSRREEGSEHVKNGCGDDE
jgi:hypothetical protein